MNNTPIFQNLFSNWKTYSSHLHTARQMAKDIPSIPSDAQEKSSNHKGT
jgi:hypothetical protein